MVFTPRSVSPVMVRARTRATPTEDPVDAEALDWFVRLRDEETRPGLEPQFRRWLDADPAHRTAFAEAEALFDGLDALTPPAPLHRPVRLWAGQSRAIAASVAAILVVGAGLAFGLTNPRPDLETGRGEVRTVRLADGSTAVLDAGSAIDVDIDAGARRITLRRGRVWFDVAHEQARPFVVRSGAAAIHDIGTGFEVSRSGQGGSVAVTEGLIELMVDDGPALRLGEGQGARFGKGVARRVPVATRIAAWRTGRLEFQDTPLPEVLRDLERYGAGKALITDERLKRVRLTGAFEARDAVAAQAAVLARAGAAGRRLGPLLIVTRAESNPPR